MHYLIIPIHIIADKNSYNSIVKHNFAEKSYNCQLLHLSVKQKSQEALLCLLTLLLDLL